MTKVEEIWNPLTKDYVKVRNRKAATDLLILGALAASTAPLSPGEISLAIARRYYGRIVRLPQAIKAALIEYEDKGLVDEVGKTDLRFEITEKGRVKLSSSLPALSVRT